MAENTRKDPRAKVLSMTVRYKSATLDEFIEHHSHDVSRGGMYIKTPQPFPPGTLLKFEVKIAADQKVMQGVGRVVWRREADDASSDHPAGMGVKFIKLDDESKNNIDQLVTARMGDISAFDEVEPVSEGALASAQPPVTATTDSGSEGFFPKSTENIPQPAPEDRTVMKQATELLQEALREVGSGTAGFETSNRTASDNEAIPRAPKAASVTPSPARSARVGGQSPSDEPPRVQKTPAPAAAPKTDVKSVSPSAQASRGVAGASSRSTTPVQVKKTPAPGATESKSAQLAGASNEQQRFEPVKSESVPKVTKKPSVEPASKTVPSSPMAARRVAQVAPAPKVSDEEDDYKLPIHRSIPAGRGMRIGIILLLVGGAAAAVLALSRKPEPAPAPAPTPTLSAPKKIESAPVVLNLGSPAPEAGPAPTATPSAAASAASSASAAAAAASIQKPTEPEKPAASEAPKAESASKVRQVPARHRRADAGAAAAPPSEKPDDLYPPTTPSKSGADTPGSTELTPPANPKLKSKGAFPPAPAGNEESNPL